MVLRKTGAVRREKREGREFAKSVGAAVNPRKISRTVESSIGSGAQALSTGGRG